MVTPQQIEKQVQLEREQIDQGVQRLRKNTCDLEDKSYASASIYGCTSIEQLMPFLVDSINEGRTRLKRGGAGPHFKEINQHLNNIETEAISLITCKISFDKIFSKDTSQRLVHKITDAIGTALEAECQLRHYEETVPGLYHYIKKTYWHESSGTQQKYVNVKTKMSHFDIKTWEPWGLNKRRQLGGAFLDKLIDATNWFDKRPVRGTKHSTYAIVPTDEFMQRREEILGIAELFSPLLWPMLVPPNDWSIIDSNKGGYLLNSVMKGHEMVRRGKCTIIQGGKPIKFLNQIQKVGYKVNTFILDIAESLYKRKVSVGKFIPIIELEIPPKPPNIDTNEEAKALWKKESTNAHNKNARALKRACRTKQTMEAARRFRDEPRYYIPWSFDYRGRTYPIPSFLTPQDTDFGKALLLFERESTVTPEAEKWLAFQVATTFGLDKAPMEERQHWVRDNIELITLIAEDPYNEKNWEEVDGDKVEEPWEFLAACNEYYHCVIKKTKPTTNLPIAIDATCSGLQILAGLARDRSTAELVNVTRSPMPQDAYKVVAMESRGNIPERIKPHWDRKCVKRTVMTIPYNAKPFSNRSYIRDALTEKKVTVENDELTQIVKAVRDAMHKVVPGPMAVMKWIEDEVAQTMKKRKYLEWTTPSGFKVHQEIMNYDNEHQERIQLQLLGKCRLRLNKLTDEPNIDRHKAATAPNLIHSLDASLLHLATIRFKHPIALIHDSVLCRATDMSILSTLVRETYMHLFAKQDYLTDFAAQIGAETKPPIIGDLEPSNVLKSTYFFC